MNAGVPRMMNKSLKASMTSPEFSFRFTLIDRHSPTEFINDIERSKDLAIIGSAMNEVPSLRLHANACRGSA